MNPRFSPETLAKYPHMAPQDIPVWEAFLTQHASQFTGFDYDVRVGKGYDPGTTFNDATRRDAILLTQKRIDAVGYRPNEIWIIEVKPEASISALGQLLTYTGLFKATYSPDLPLRRIVVCNTVDPDILPIFTQYDVLLIQV